MTIQGVGHEAVFFDRDGTLNWPALPGEYIRRSEELRLLPGAAEAVRRINEAGFPAILVTNQRWLSEPDADTSAYSLIESRLSSLLAAEGARLDASYTCPHATHECSCRKPLPGLLVRAADELGLSLTSSYFIGDSMTDMQAGAAAGVTTILISSRHHHSSDSRLVNHVVSDVKEAVEVIFSVICT